MDQVEIKTKLSSVPLPIPPFAALPRHKKSAKVDELPMAREHPCIFLLNSTLHNKVLAQRIAHQAHTICYNSTMSSIRKGKTVRCHQQT